MRAPTLNPPVVTTFDCFLNQLGRWADRVPESLMRAAGWTMVRCIHVDLSNDAAVKCARPAVDAAILEAWPASVRLTCDPVTGSILVWQHPHPPPDSSGTGPFPKAVDREHALRTLQAIGAARADRANDQVARLAASSGTAAAIAMVKRKADEDQLHFEHVAAALRNFTPSDR